MPRGGKMERPEYIFEKLQREGENAIDEFITTRKSEELFLDFKRSADNGAGIVLHANDRNNLAKAISGFGNSEGGVIIWGVDCRKDVSGADVVEKSHKIADVTKFVSWLEGAISGCTVPPHVGVRSLAISVDSSGNGYAVIYIPRSERAPHQVVGKLQYYMRAGSDFVPVPHGVLAGMFGRRPQPHVYHQRFILMPTTIQEIYAQIEVAFLIRNDGPGIAENLFINAMALSLPGNNCKMKMTLKDADNWISWQEVGRHFSLISKPHLRLPPEAYIKSMSMQLLLAPPFTKDLKIVGICGSAGAAPNRFTIENEARKIERLYTDFIDKERQKVLTEDDSYKFAANILAMETTRKA
jgi:hypothetical protein